jgi:hypothetical protein
VHGKNAKGFASGEPFDAQMLQQGLEPRTN